MDQLTYATAFAEQLHGHAIRASQDRHVEGVAEAPVEGLEGDAGLFDVAHIDRVGQDDELRVVAVFDRVLEDGVDRDAVLAKRLTERLDDADAVAEADAHVEGRFKRVAKRTAHVPCTMSRMSETHELAVGYRPAPWPTNIDETIDCEVICTALVAPLIEASELLVGTKTGDTNAEIRLPPGLSSLATPSSFTVPPCNRAYLGIHKDQKPLDP
eukprot:6202864-Pleurochrysis_carterae.AAC.3